MASKAYLELMKQIPKDIQNDVRDSIDIANEIHEVLKMKGLSPADLAREMDKSESEISKWMSGQHNFTFKTVRKIARALGEELLVMKSSKIDKYEDKLKRSERKIFLLKQKIGILENEKNRDKDFHELDNFMFVSEKIEQGKDANSYFAVFNVNVTDNIRLVPQTKSKYTISTEGILN